MKHAKELDSSFVRNAEYDDETKELRITLASGRTYAYPDVDPEVYDDLVHAKSAGAFFNKTIVRNYIGKQIKEKDDE